MKKIVIIEPACADNIHLPFNSGLVATVASAYKLAEIIFVGELKQNLKIVKMLPVDCIARCKFKDWNVYPDRDTSPIDFYRRFINLFKIAGKDILAADLIVLTAATGTTLAALDILMRRDKQKLQIFMHGNLNNLYGWRSRNPLKKRYDLYAGFRRATKNGAQLLVLEKHILVKAMADFPWMENNIDYFPHPQVESELLCHEKKLSFPIKIGLAGVSSPEKGFTEFCNLAKQLKERFPEKFEFHVIGKKHEANDSADFKWLDQPPSDAQLERNEYLHRLDSMHFLFFWPVGDYYKNASSGVFYDGMNRKIPFLCNFAVELFHVDIEKMAIIGKSVNDLESQMLTLDDGRYQTYISYLDKFSKNFSLEALAKRLRALNDGVYFSN